MLLESKGKRTRAVCRQKGRGLNKNQNGGQAAQSVETSHGTAGKTKDGFSSYEAEGGQEAAAKSDSEAAQSATEAAADGRSLR